MDLKKLCRICLRIPKRSVDLFTNEEILLKLDIIASIKPEKAKDLPDQICEECSKNVNFVYKFRKLIVNTEDDLQSRLETLKQTNYTSKPRTAYHKGNDIKGFIKEEFVSDAESDLSESVLENLSRINDDAVEDSKRKCICRCNECDLIFDSNDELQIHRYCHHSELGTSVTAYNITAAEIKSHMELESDSPSDMLHQSDSEKQDETNSNKTRKSCEECHRVFRSKYQLLVHKRIVHGEDLPKKKCHICGIEVHYYGISKHIRLHSAKPCRCEVCGKVLKNSGSLTSHMKVHSNAGNKRTSKCKECEIVFYSTYQLLIHKKDAHGHALPNKRCTICGLEVRYFSLKAHMRLHSAKPCRCDICGKMLKNPSTLSGHMKIHFNGKRKVKKIKCQCDQCGKVFDSSGSLDYHKNYHHKPKAVCNICGAQMVSCSLPQHMKIHLEEPCRCKECGKLLKNSGSLRCHMKLHTNVESTCNICGKMFNVRRQYLSHMRVNHGDPDYLKKSCHLCGLKLRGSSMKRHMLKHTGERPYVCSHCNKGLTSPYALKVHMRIHTKEKPYLCEFCSSSFPQRVSLRTHLKREHGMSLVGDKYTKL